MSFGKDDDDEIKRLRQAQEQQAALTAQVAQGPIAAQELQRPVLDIFQSILRGERPSTLKVFAPERETLEAQFGRARENVIGTTPARGGLLTRMLGDLETERARAVTGLESDVRKAAFPMAASLAFGAPLSALPGISAAGAQFGDLAERLAQEQAGFGRTVGQTAAKIGMMAAKAALG
ncbi:MAG: hypothetical protein HY323_09220 [Betaproteobacteria bacterium]|nr:hypothetical protein [Betaproteobacteria bacterium]